MRILNFIISKFKIKAPCGISNVMWLTLLVNLLKYFTKTFICEIYWLIQEKLRILLINNILALINFSGFHYDLQYN